MNKHRKGAVLVPLPKRKPERFEIIEAAPVQRPRLRLAWLQWVLVGGLAGWIIRGEVTSPANAAGVEPQPVERIEVVVVITPPPTAVAPSAVLQPGESGPAAAVAPEDTVTPWIVTATPEPSRTPTPTSLPTDTVTPRPSTYTVEVSKVDDDLFIWINGQKICKAKWGHSGCEPEWEGIGHRQGDSGEIDLAPWLIPGENTLEFELYDLACCGAAVEIVVRRGRQVIWSDSFVKQSNGDELRYARSFSFER